MTAQAAEILIHKGERLSLCETPLGDYLACAGSGIKFEASSTALWRGYIGTWEIIETRHYLVALKGLQIQNSKPVDVELADVFPKFPQGLFAHWYSGELRCPRGKLLEYVHGGYLSTYEEDLFIKVDKGIVIGELLVVNGQGKDRASEGYALAAATTFGKGQ